MTLEEFPRWEDGTDTRYELIRGVPVAREIPWVAHSIVQTHACVIMHSTLDRRSDYFVLPSFAAASPTQRDTCYLADLVVEPYPMRPQSQLAADPLVIVEVLSEGSAVHDREKALDYREIPSVQEVLLIDSRRVHVELHEQRGFDWRVRIVNDLSSKVSLASIGIEIPLAELYNGLVLDEDE